MAPDDQPEVRLDVSGRLVCPYPQEFFYNSNTTLLFVPISVVIEITEK